MHHISFLLNFYSGSSISSLTITLNEGTYDVNQNVAKIESQIGAITLLG